MHTVGSLLALRIYGYFVTMRAIKIAFACQDW